MKAVNSPPVGSDSLLGVSRFIANKTATVPLEPIHRSDSSSGVGFGSTSEFHNNSNLESGRNTVEAACSNDLGGNFGIGPDRIDRVSTFGGPKRIRWSSDPSCESHFARRPSLPSE